MGKGAIEEKNQGAVGTGLDKGEAIPETGDPTDERAIQRNLIQNVTIVWCISSAVCINTSPCARVSCPYKKDEVRQATAKELASCRGYQITTGSPDYAAATPLFPPARPQ